MTIIDPAVHGVRRSMANPDASRSAAVQALRTDVLPERQPEPALIPERPVSRRPEPEEQPEEKPLRKRLRRPAEGPRAEMTEAVSFTPAGPKGKHQPEREPVQREPGGIRQSARRRTEAPEPPAERLPAERRSYEPDVHTTSVEVRDSGTEVALDEMRAEIERLNARIDELEGRSTDTRGLSAVERAMQRLAERMDRIDGGPLPRASTTRAARHARRASSAHCSVRGLSTVEPDPAWR